MRPALSSCTAAGVAGAWRGGGGQATYMGIKRRATPAATDTRGRRAAHHHVFKQRDGLWQRLQQRDQLRELLVLARSTQGGHQGVRGGRVETRGDLCATWGGARRGGMRRTEVSPPSSPPPWPDRTGPPEHRASKPASKHACLVGHQHAHRGGQRFRDSQPLALPAADAAGEGVSDLRQIAAGGRELACFAFWVRCRPPSVGLRSQRAPTCVSAHSSRPSVRSRTSTYSCSEEESAASAAMAAAMAGSGRMPSSLSLASSAASSSAWGAAGRRVGGP